MEYNTEIHMPQQIENLLQAYASGDVEALTRIKDNLMDIINDNTFKNDLKAFESDKAKSIDNIKKKALDAIKTLSEAKNIDSVFIDYEEIKADLIKALNETEQEYWESLKDYVIGWTQQMEK